MKKVERYSLSSQSKPLFSNTVGKGGLTLSLLVRWPTNRSRVADNLIVSLLLSLHGHNDQKGEENLYSEIGR